MSRTRKQRGFSLMELTMASALTLGLSGTVFYMLKQNQELYTTQGAAMELQQDFRASLDLIKRDVQAAGAGLPAFMGPIAGDDGGTAANGSALTDEIMLMYGDNAFPALTVNGPVAGATTAFTAQNPSGSAAPAFTNGQTYVLYAKSAARTTPANATDNAEFNIFSLSAQTAVTGGTTLTPAAATSLSLPAWSNMTAFPSMATLQLARLSEVIRYRMDPATSSLQRRRNGGDWVSIAAGITDLQIQYRMELSDTTMTVVDEPGITATSNRALIRSVLLTLSGMRPAAAPNMPPSVISQTIEITPRNLTLPGFVPNR
ncbi:MAG: PilW family protein [Blastocatellia bacterium]